MIDIYDSETCVKVYRLLNKKCQVLDKFINNHAIYFGAYTDEYGSADVYENIIKLMTKKNQLINLKIMIDDAISHLNEVDKKIILLKMNYNVSMEEVCGILNMKERTAFRRMECAFENMTKIFNASKYASRLERILDEEWLSKIKAGVKERRLAFSTKACDTTQNVG